MEPVAIAEFESRTGKFVESGRFVLHEDWAGSAPDGFIDGNPVEVKCPVKMRDVFETPHELAQIRWHMMICQRAYAHYVCAVFDSGDNLQEFNCQTVKIDPVEEEKLHQAGSDFWNELQDILADPEQCQPYLDPLVENREDDEWAAAAAQYKFAKENADQAAKIADKAKKALIGLAHSDRQAGAGVSVTMVPGRTSYDWKAAQQSGVDVSRFEKKGAQSWRITIAKD